MKFDEAHALWIQQHVSMRNGERKRRLIKGHGHAEKTFAHRLWWPLFKHFENLHPEYEVFDLKGSSRFIDFAFIHALFRIAFEIDGFGPHVRQMSRWKFSDQLNRQNELVATGWQVIRFSYDDLIERPAACQHIIQLTIGRFLGEESGISMASVMEKELLRLAVRLARPITSRDVLEHFGVEVRTARKLLQQACRNGLLKPVGENKQRIHKYALNVNHISGLL